MGFITSVRPINWELGFRGENQDGGHLSPYDVSILGLDSEDIGGLFLVGATSCLYWSINKLWQSHAVPSTLIIRSAFV